MDRLNRIACGLDDCCCGAATLVVDRQERLS